MSLTLHEQLAKHIEDPVGYNVFPDKNWTLDQYQEMFEYIGQGWLVQTTDHHCDFIVNPEWEGEPMWEPEEEEEEDLCPCCGTDCDDCHMEKKCSCPEEEENYSPCKTKKEQELVDCDFCGVKEDPDEIIKGTEGKACGSCRHLCDKEEGPSWWVAPCKTKEEQYELNELYRDCCSCNGTRMHKGDPCCLCPILGKKISR